MVLANRVPPYGQTNLETGLALLPTGSHFVSTKPRPIGRFWNAFHPILFNFIRFSMKFIDFLGTRSKHLQLISTNMIVGWSSSQLIHRQLWSQWLCCPSGCQSWRKDQQRICTSLSSLQASASGQPSSSSSW